MRLSIIIVNYKTSALVSDCLESLYRYDTADTEIFVVDNDSADNIEEMLLTSFPKIIFIQMGYNAGFARANNAAIRKARGENILLMNADTINLEDAVNKCDDALRRSDFAACGVQLLNEDMSPQVSGNFAMKGGLNYLLPLPYTGAFLKGIANLLKVKKPSIEKAEAVTEVDWVNGAFIMVKRKAIEQAGLMDEDFFLYAEEAEWCSRIKKVGPLGIFGKLHVMHLQGEASNAAFNSAGRGYFNLFDKKGLQIMASNFVRIRKQFGVFWFLADLAVYVLTIPVFFMGLLFSKILFFGKSRYSFLQLSGFCRNVFSLIRISPVIIRNKPYFYKFL